MFWEVVGVLAATCTTSGLIPQIIRGLRTKRLDDVSPWMMLLLMVGCTLWLFYGIHLGDKIIIGANGTVVALAATVLYLRARYIKKRIGGHGSGY